MELERKQLITTNIQYHEIHHLFTDILDEHGLCQIVEEPTRGSNMLDLIVTNYPTSFSRTEIIPGVSDHDIVFTEVNILPVKHRQKPRTIPLYREAKWDNVKQDLHNIHQCITKMDEENQSVESMWNIFLTKLQESIQKNIPQKKARKKDGCPWIKSDLRRLIRKRDRWYRRRKKSGNQQEAKKYKTLKQVTKRQLRKAYWSYIEDIVTPNMDKQEDTNSNSMRHF